MTRREKILALTLSAGIVMAVAYSWIDSESFQGKPGLSDSLEHVSERLELAQQKLVELKQRHNELEETKAIGLSGDPAVATLVFQEVMVEYLRQSGITAPSITTGAPIPEQGLGSRVSFSLQMDATADQLGSFLDYLEATEILNRVKLLSMQSTNNVDSEVCSVSMTIEVLLLDDAKGKMVAELLKPSIQTDYGYQLKSLHPIGRSTKDESIAFNLAALLPTSTDVAPNEVQVESPAQIDQASAENTAVPAVDTFQLVGVIGQGKERKAMIYRSLSQELLTVQLNEEIPNKGENLEVLRTRVKGIGNSSILIDRQGRERTVQIGELL